MDVEVSDDFFLQGKKLIFVPFQIHTSLINGRPGANETSPELLEFTKARYVRLRLQGFRGSVEPLPRWLSQDIAKDKRLFYSIRDISVGGQCVCNGHAANCRHNVASGVSIFFFTNYLQMKTINLIITRLLNGSSR